MALTVASFKTVDPFIGAQPLQDTSTTRQHDLGKEIDVRDDTYGYGRAVYLQGAASTVAGDAVTYANNFATTRATTRSKGRMAIALSANVASQFGWYLVIGTCPATAVTVVSGANVFLTATPGSLDDLPVAGDQVIGAVWAGATDTGQALITINRPQGTDSDNA